MEKNLTTGSVFKNVVLFSLPYLLSYFLQTLSGMADLFIIGQFEGVASTTAVSIGSQVMHMAYGYDCRACDGNDGQHRASHRCGRPQAGGKGCGQHRNIIYGGVCHADGGLARAGASHCFGNVHL